MLALALAARVSRCPLFQRSKRAAISVLTAEEDAPGFWGPRIKVGNKNNASQAAPRRLSPLMSVALLKSSVSTGSRAGRLGLGMVTDD
jgi:hypothetical protein